MSYRIMFVITSLVTFLLGLAFLIVPSIAIKQFGVDDYASTRMVTQFYGTAMLTLGLVLWFAGGVSDEGAQRGMGIGVLVGAAAGLIVTILATTGGTLRALGWAAMLLYVLVGLGFGYLIFLKPRTTE